MRGVGRITFFPTLSSLWGLGKTLENLHALQCAVQSPMTALCAIRNLTTRGLYRKRKSILKTHTVLSSGSGEFAILRPRVDRSETKRKRSYRSYQLVQRESTHFHWVLFRLCSVMRKSIDKRKFDQYNVAKVRLSNARGVATCESASRASDNLVSTFCDVYPLDGP